MTHQAVKGARLDEVAAVFQLDKAGIRVIFRAEEDLGDLRSIAAAALVRAGLAAEPDARVPARELLSAWAVARRSIAGLMAEFAADVVGTAPGAGLLAGCAVLAAEFPALAVHTTILAGLAAWRAVLAALGRAGVTTEQDPVAGALALHAESTPATRSTAARARMRAVQSGRARIRAVARTITTLDLDLMAAGEV